MNEEPKSQDFAGRGSADFAWLVPAIFSLLVGCAIIARSASLTHDTIVFLRIARQLAGEFPLPDTSEQRAKRQSWEVKLLKKLERIFPWIRALEAEHQHPGYPISIVITQKVIGKNLSSDPIRQWERSAQMVGLLGGILTGLGVYRLTKLLSGWESALAASLIVVASPVFMRTYADGLSDSLGLACMTWSLWAGIRTLSLGRPKDACLLAGLGSVGYLFRPEMIQAVPIIAMILFVRIWLSPRVEMGRRITSFALMILVTLVICAPYMFIRGSVFTKKSHLFDAGNVSANVTAPPSVPNVNDLNTVPATETKPIASTPVDVPRPRPEVEFDHSPRIARKTTELKGNYVASVLQFLGAWGRDLGIVFFPAVIVGLAYGLFFQRNGGLWILGVLIAFNFAILPWMLGYRSGYLDNRHLLPTTIWSAPFLWSGLLILGSLFESFGRLFRLPRTVDRRGISWFTLALGVIVFAGVALSRPLNYQRAGLRDIGWKLRAERRFQDEVIDPTLLAAYYANADEHNRWSRDPDFTNDKLFGLVRQFPAVRFVVLDDLLIASMSGLALKEGEVTLRPIEQVSMDLLHPGGEKVTLFEVARQRR